MKNSTANLGEALIWIIGGIVILVFGEIPIVKDEYKMVNSIEYQEFLKRHNIEMTFYEKILYNDSIAGKHYYWENY